MPPRWYPANLSWLKFVMGNLLRNCRQSTWHLHTHFCWTDKVRDASNLAFSSTPLIFRFAFPPFFVLLLIVHSPLTTVQPSSYMTFYISWLCGNQHLLRSHVSFNKCHCRPITSQTATSDKCHRLPIVSQIRHVQWMPSPANSITNPSLPTNAIAWQ